MTGRHNHGRTHDEKLHEYRLHEQIQRGEKIVGTEAHWLDNTGPAMAAGRQSDALTRHSGGRQGRQPKGPHAARRKRLR